MIEMIIGDGGLWISRRGGGLKVLGDGGARVSSFAGIGLAGVPAIGHSGVGGKRISGVAGITSLCAGAVRVFGVGGVGVPVARCAGSIEEALEISRTSCEGTDTGGATPEGPFGGDKGDGAAVAFFCRWRSDSANQ